MKTKLLLILVSFSISTFGQLKVANTSQTPIKVENQLNTQSKSTDSIKVVYKYKQKNQQEPVYYVNNQFAGNHIDWIKPDDISNIDVVKGPEGSDQLKKEVGGRINITLKDSTRLHLLSLTDIKNTYLKTTSPFCIYMINNQLYNDDINNCFIDKGSILQINVDRIKSKVNNSDKKVVDIDVIEILTDTKENIEKSKEIRIR